MTPGTPTATTRPVTPVGLLAASLTRLHEQAEASDAIDPEFVASLRAARVLASGLEAYVADCTSPESADLRRLSERTARHDWTRAAPERVVAGLEREMLSGHVEGVVLRFLAQMTGATQVLEIGTFTGYSALALAEALGAGGRVVGCELDPEAAAFARTALDEADAGHRVEIRVGPALETLARLADAHERFDLVFIDADKPGYTGYLHAVLDGDLLAPDGTIAVDNTLLQGEPWSPDRPSRNGEAIALFNAAVAGDPRVEQVLLPVRDGLTLIRRAP